MKVLLLLLCLLVGPVFVLAQKKDKDDNKPDQWPVEVHVNLAVTDAAQKPLSDLKVSDIKLFENDVEQRVTYFAKRPVSNVAFVMDNTGSMKTSLATMASLGTVISNNFVNNEQALVIRFVSYDNITIQQDWTTDKAKLKEAFTKLFVEGGQSAVCDGIYVAANKLLEESKSKPENRYAMIVMTDGQDIDSFYNEKQLFSLLRGTSIQIFVVGLTGGLRNEAHSGRVSDRERAENFLHKLAVRTGGQAYIFSKYSREDLEEFVRSVVTELRSPFVIGFNPTNQSRDGSSRKLRVEIADGPNGEKRLGVVRSSFAVPKD